MKTNVQTKQVTQSCSTSIADGVPFEVGSGFSANSYRAPRFDGLMDPLVMVDHYTMTAPTFGAHPHAGLSAVSVLFEESEGAFHNRDSLGNDFDLLPGDLYWLKAGSGVIHDEYPRADAAIRGLQVFVNLPERQRYDAPESLHVRSQTMPVIECESYRVRVVLGSSHGQQGAEAPPHPMTILDGKIARNAVFTHRRAVTESSWLLAIDGEIEVTVDKQTQRLQKGQALAINTADSAAEQGISILGRSSKRTQFVLFCAEPTGEHYVQEGPFVMGSESELRQIKARFDAGELGTLHVMAHRV